VPRIADSIDGIDAGLLDYELWQRLDRNMGHISEHLEDHDFKKEKSAHYRDYRDEVRSYILKYLVDKLSRKLNVPSTTIPWSEMGAEDIINWPSEVRFMPVYKMSKTEFDKLYALAKDDQLDFSPGLISRLREHLAKSKLSRSKKNQNIIRDIEVALCNQLNARTNKKFKKVPWTMLKKEDIINWPKEIPVVRLSQHRLKRLKLLHELRDEIFFSEEFIRKLSDPAFISHQYRRFISSGSQVRGVQGLT
jgi:hypothetical protein